MTQIGGPKGSTQLREISGRVPRMPDDDVPDGGEGSISGLPSGYALKHIVLDRWCILFTLGRLGATSSWSLIKSACFLHGSFTGAPFSRPGLAICVLFITAVWIITFMTS